MGSNTPNHSFYKPTTDETGWGDDKNSDWDDLDVGLILKDTAANRPAAGTAGRWYLATDTLELSYDNGTSWELVVDGSNVTHTDVSETVGSSWDFTGGLTKGGTEVFDKVAAVIDSPNGLVPNTALDDGESVELSVPVADGETLTVYRWGAYQISDGTTPTDLDVELLDGSDTVQATANTGDTENTSGTASHANSSGSTSIFKLAIANDTGSPIGDPGVGGFFGFIVE